MPSLPAFFTRYMELSALMRRSFIVEASSGYIAMPRLAVALTGVLSDVR
jgi:hypothetical protein